MQVYQQMRPDPELRGWIRRTQLQENPKILFLPYNPIHGGGAVPTPHPLFCFFVHTQKSKGNPHFCCGWDYKKK